MTTETLQAKYTKGSVKLPDNALLREGEQVLVIRFVKAPKTTGKTDDHMDSESRSWLEADFTESLPPYDWGKEGIPEGKPVRYEPENGFIIVGDELIET